MRIAICDDDKLYLKSLNHYIKPLINHSELYAIYPNDLLNQVSNNAVSYDILITDIDMGNINGIDLAMKIKKINPSCIIIFISNHLNFATDVYEVEHIYFILKTEIKKRLPKALNKAQELVREQKSKFLKISYQKTDYIIALQDILFIEALGRYLYIHTLNQTYKCIHSLKMILSDLTDHFVRCHNSYIINLSHINSMNRTRCELKNSVEIPVSHTYTKNLQSAYLSYVSVKMS